MSAQPTNETNEYSHYSTNASIKELMDKNEHQQEADRQRRNNIHMKLDAYKYTANDAKSEAIRYANFIANNITTLNFITEGMTMNAISDAFLLKFAETEQHLNYPDSEKLNTEPVTYVRPSNMKREHFVYDKVMKGYSQIMYDS